VWRICSRLVSWKQQNTSDYRRFSFPNSNPLYSVTICMSFVQFDAQCIDLMRKQAQIFDWGKMEILMLSESFQLLTALESGEGEWTLECFCNDYAFFANPNRGLMQERQQQRAATLQVAIKSKLTICHFIDIYNKLKNPKSTSSNDPRHLTSHIDPCSNTLWDDERQAILMELLSIVLHANWKTAYEDPPFTADDLRALATQNHFLIQLQ
jgi:hypothetical protein